MNARRLVERWLPAAVSWAEAQERRSSAAGLVLTEPQRALARDVGVERPERVRLHVVDVFPQPEDPSLRAVAHELGLLGPTMQGLTLGYAILLTARGESQPNARALNFSSNRGAQTAGDSGIIEVCQRRFGGKGSLVARLDFCHGLLRRGHQDEERLLRHELRHVHQYEAAGSTASFLAAYLDQILDFGYHDAPYEVDARRHE